MATPKPGDLIAQVGMNYPSATDGKERRVEAGDIVNDMSPLAQKNEISVGNLKEFAAEPEASVVAEAPAASTSGTEGE